LEKFLSRTPNAGEGKYCRPKIRWVRTKTRVAKDKKPAAWAKTRGENGWGGDRPPSGFFAEKALGNWVKKKKRHLFHGDRKVFKQGSKQGAKKVVNKPPKKSNGTHTDRRRGDPLKGQKKGPGVLKPHDRVKYQWKSSRISSTPCRNPVRGGPRCPLKIHGQKEGLKGLKNKGTGKGGWPRGKQRENTIPR